MLADFRAGLQKAIEALDSSKVVDFDIDLWELYNEGWCTLAFYKALADIRAIVNVLDVGCGRFMTISMMVDKGLSPMAYTGVDRVINHAVISKGVASIPSTRFIAKDYEDVKESDLDPAGYDMLIVDIEPHGREEHVYEHFKRFLKPVHLCILKHVGCLDGYGGYLANKFLHTYINSGHVCDYYAVHDWTTGFRDVFVIMSTTTVPLDAQCQKLGTGELPSNVDSETQYLRHHYSGMA